MPMLELPVRQRGQSCEITTPIDQDWVSETAALLRILADPTRLAIVWCLYQAAVPVCICDFTATFDLGQPTVSHHMAKLKAAGLVESDKQGLWTYYHLRDDLPPTALGLLETLITGAKRQRPPGSG